MRSEENDMLNHVSFDRDEEQRPINLDDSSDFNQAWTDDSSLNERALPGTHSIDNREEESKHI